MRFVVPLIAALVPLVITPGWLSHFDITPKMAILLCGLTLIFLYPSAIVHNVYELLRRPAGRWFAVLLAATWIACALAAALSTHPALSLNGSTWRRYGLASETGLLLFVLLAAGWLAAGVDAVRMFLRASTASGAIASLYGIAQYFGWDPLLPSHAYQAGEGAFTIVRPPGTLGHADYFAAWLVVVTFLALALRRLEPAGMAQKCGGPRRGACGGSDHLERDALGDGRPAGWSNRLCSHFAATGHHSHARRGCDLHGIAGRVFLFAAWSQAAGAAALVHRGRARRRAIAAVARHAADGRTSPVGRLRPGDLRHRVSAL